MQLLLEKIATQMANSLRDYTTSQQISITSIRFLFKDADVTVLDELDSYLEDEGEGRELFDSLSHEYAIKFSPDPQSDIYNTRKEEVELRAMKLF